MDTDTTTTVEGTLSAITTSPVGALLIFLVSEATGPESWQLAEWACAEYGVDATDLESAVSDWREADSQAPSWYGSQGGQKGLQAESRAYVVETMLDGI